MTYGQRMQPCSPPLSTEWAKYTCDLSKMSSLLLLLNVTFPSTFRKIWPTIPHLKDSICYSDSCIKGASRFISNVDYEQSPCEDMYQFSCSGFMERHLPEFTEEVTPMSLALADYNKEIENLIKYRNATAKTFRIETSLLDCYDACINIKKINSSSGQPLLQALRSLGKWPAIHNEDFQGKKFDWLARSRDARLKGLYWKTFFSTTTTYSYGQKPMITLTPNLKFPVGFNNTPEEEDKNMKYLLHIASLLKFDKQKVTNDINKVKNFLQPLLNISQCSTQMKIITLKDLKKSVIKIDWDLFLDRLYYPINLSNKENISVSICLESFLKTVLDVVDKTSKRDIANYMMWNIIWNAVKYLSEDFQTPDSKEKLSFVSDKKRSEFCIDRTRTSLPFYFAATFSEKFINQETKQSLKSLGEAILKQFIQTVRSAEWIPIEIRNKTLKQLTDVKLIVSYPPNDKEAQELEKHYKSVVISNQDYFDNEMSLAKFETNLNFGLLRSENFQTFENHRKFSLINEISFQMDKNILIVPMLFSTKMVFLYDLPKAVNYGSIGVAIASILIRAFTSTLSPDILLKGNDRLRQCILSLYEINIEKNQTELLTNIIAHVDGIFLAYEAFEEQMFHAKTSILPGLNMTSNQLFWMAAANNYCYIDRRQKLSAHKQRLYKDRLFNKLMENYLFIRDFNCPLNSPIQFAASCSFWF